MIATNSPTLSPRTSEDTSMEEERRKGGSSVVFLVESLVILVEIFSCFVSPEDNLEDNLEDEEGVVVVVVVSCFVFGTRCITYSILERTLSILSATNSSSTILIFLLRVAFLPDTITDGLELFDILAGEDE